MDSRTSSFFYTGDVYCAVDENIGYAGLAAYKKQVEEETPYVALVDCGDALQGDAIGTISQGEYLVDIMNKVGYDFAVLGNHEFDYGMERLAELMEMSDAAYLGCNVDYTGSGENALSALQQYEIVDYGDTKVAFIGISAPESISQSTPAYFMDENGDIVYSFCSDSGEALYSRVQETVDSCREEGADYVIALTHLRDDESSAPFRSTDLIAGTSGIDAVLDSDSHSAIDSDMVEKEEGREIPLSSSGTGLENIGQLTITPEGDITTRLISDFEEKDSDMESFIADIQSEYEEELQQVIAGSDVDETYTLASHDYMLRQSGDGFTMFAGNEMVVEEGMVDYQILITYISDYLGGSIGEQYSSPDGRITVE